MTHSKNDKADRISNRATKQDDRPEHDTIMKHLATAALQLIQANSKLKSQLVQTEAIAADLETKAHTFNALCNIDGLYSLESAARLVMCQCGRTGMRPKALIQLLQEQRLLFKSDGVWLPKARLVQRGYFRIKLRKVAREYKMETFVSAEGLDYINQILSRRRRPAPKSDKGA